MLPLLLSLTAMSTRPASLPPSELRETIEQFRADENGLQRVYALPLSENRRTRLTAFYDAQLRALQTRKFDSLGGDAQVDYVLLRNYLERETHQLTLEGKEQARYAPLMPFAKAIIDLEESRRRFEEPNPEKAASVLNDLLKSIKELKPQLGEKLKAKKFEGNQAFLAIRGLRDTLKSWFTYFNGYNPMFTWWCAEPYKKADTELKAYADAVREKIVGVKPDDEDAIVGNPIGREALLAEMKYELIPYTPEELLAIADREYAWCEKEAKRAAHDMGFGDDWKKALEKVKNDHVSPGEQPEFIRFLAGEAVEFLEKNDLVTVPELAKEDWRMEMMSPERQRVNPFFLGGESIIVSFPTDAMTHEEKLMSLRANNKHFSRATVFHELIPGHHLQGFMNARYKPYRRSFGTPFWTEGWALYWEMLLWDLDFPKTPENRMGMLFWRMHRCARIIFSLKFHLGEMTPEQCIDFLVEKVGHERASAEGEVRRSFNGSYSPLYQLAYMIGGLQFRAMHKELVESGKMTNRQFHDAILHENNMPVEMVRAALTHQKLTPNFKSTWKF